MRIWVLAGACGALAGCGGGGGSGGTAPAITVPVATPTPSPSPSPSPSPTYDIAFDLARDRSFALLGSELTYTQSRSSPQSVSGVNSSLYDAGAGVFLNYTAANRSSTISLGNAGSEIFNEPTFQRADQIVYNQGSRYLSLFRPGREIGGLPSDLAYTIGSVQYRSTVTGNGNSQDQVERRWIGGIPTIVSDVPQSGTVSYATFLNGIGIAPGDTGTSSLERLGGNVNINFANRTVTASITTTRQVTLTFTGQVVGNSERLTGSISGSNGGTGIWQGRLFGPTGREFGLIYSYSQGGSRFIGNAFGIRQ